MKLYSTNNPEYIVELKEAVLKSLPPDKGLYMPEHIPHLSDEFIQELPNKSFQDIALEVAFALIGSYIPKEELSTIIQKSIDFPAPVHIHDDHVGTLELWHGPSLAFKDFGARFMAELISYFIRNEKRQITILVATSGDTGGAVASGFYDTPGIEVVILYPKGKVSVLQEKQLTTLGKNVTALEIEGTFDDCQAIVKTAFLDSDLSSLYDLSSANSINIARLIPQAFYYFEAYKQVAHLSENIVFAVPSGNFGNLTAGLVAKKMGLPIHHFIAATNVNNVVPEYLLSGVYKSRSSVATISNAMDVGAPSNFIRLIELYGREYEEVIKDISGFYMTDDEDRATMKSIYEDHDYIADPHGAIGYAAIRNYQKDNPNTFGVYLETAHPAKFLDVMKDVLGDVVDIPPRLAELADKEKVAVPLSASFNSFKDWMLARK